MVAFIREIDPRTNTRNNESIFPIPIENSVPMAGLLLQHLDPIHIDPQTHRPTHPWDAIIEKGHPYDWQTIMLMLVRKSGRDKTGLLPKLIGISNDPEEIRAELNRICLDEYRGHIEDALKPDVVKLLNEDRTVSEQNIVPAMFALNVVANHVNSRLDKQMTDAAREIRRTNYEHVLTVLEIPPKAQDRIINPDNYRDSPEIYVRQAPLYYSPNVNSGNLVNGVRYTIPNIELPQENIDAIRKITPKVYSITTPDPHESQDPEKNPDFLASTILKIGLSWVRGALQVKYEKEQNDKRHQTEKLERFFGDRVKPPKDPEPWFQD
jgi:hypothetical protein